MATHEAEHQQAVLDNEWYERAEIVIVAIEGKLYVKKDRYGTYDVEVTLDGVNSRLKRAKGRR